MISVSISVNYLSFVFIVGEFIILLIFFMNLLYEMINDLYLFTKCTEDTVIAENLNHGICLSKCKNCFVFGFANGEVSLKDCIEAVTGLAEELKDHDFDF